MEPIGSRSNRQDSLSDLRTPLHGQEHTCPSGSKSLYRLEVKVLTLPIHENTITPGVYVKAVPHTTWPT